MPLLIRNARVLTLALPSAPGAPALSRPRRGKELGELGIIPQGDVLVADGKISAVAPKLETPPDAEVIDAQGRVLMPGFVDCHTHICWAGDRLTEWEQKLKGVPHAEILRSGGGIQATVRAVREATKKQLAAHLKNRLDLLLRDGTTTVEIKSGYGLQAEEELKMLRAIVRAGNEWPGTIVPTALLGHAYEGDLDEYARMVVKEMLPAVSKEFPDVTVDAYCETGAWNVEACVRFFEKASKHHPIRVHADQFTSLGMVPEAVRLGARSVDHLEASSKADLHRSRSRARWASFFPAPDFIRTGGTPAEDFSWITAAHSHWQPTAIPARPRRIRCHSPSRWPCGSAACRPPRRSSPPR